MPGHDLSDDLALLESAAREAGEIAMRHFRKDPKTWEKADDAGPVTEADLAVDEMLHDRLTGARPAYGWLSEEREDTDRRLSQSSVFVVDPIDGTRAFIDGQSAFAHSLALVRDGVAVAGVVYLPAQDQMFTAARDLSAFLNADPIRADDPLKTRDAPVLTTRATMAAANWPGGVPPIDRQYRPSVAYRLALVGSGRFAGTVSFRQTWEWDVAAGGLIAEEAGALVTDATGQALRYNRKDPRVNGIMVAGPRLHDDMLSRRAA